MRERKVEARDKREADGGIQCTGKKISHKEDNDRTQKRANKAGCAGGNGRDQRQRAWE
jgi:hypothetical protein